MSTLSKLEPLTAEEYLDGELHGEVRHEYVHGAIEAMVGASAKHNLLAGTLAAAMRTHLRGTPCHVFQSDMKVRIDEVFYYPDLMVTCGKLDLFAYYQTAPTLIVEILSPTTAAKDRLEKRVAYQRLDSLKEYVLVAQDELRVEVIRRQSDGWALQTFGPGETACFEAIDFEMPIAELYAEVLPPG